MRFAEALPSNNDRNFWGEAKKVRYNKSLCSNMVDDCCIDADTADLFAHKYHDLYTSVPSNVNDMDVIRPDLSASIQVVSGECIFSSNDVLMAVDKLKLYKADGVKDYLLII